MLFPNASYLRARPLKLCMGKRWCALRVAHWGPQGLLGSDMLSAPWWQTFSTLFPFSSQLLFVLPLLINANSQCHLSFFPLLFSLFTSFHMCLSFWRVGVTNCPSRDQNAAWSRCCVDRRGGGVSSGVPSSSPAQWASPPPPLFSVCFLPGLQLSRIAGVTGNLVSAYILFSICFWGTL